MAAKPGEVWLADLGLAAKTRPVVILSREDPNAPRALVTYVPLGHGAVVKDLGLGLLLHNPLGVFDSLYRNKYICINAG
jgi:mRNA-degrading endonuclease toxin of MazEF toxin-antitoxin module